MSELLKPLIIASIIIVVLFMIYSIIKLIKKDKSKKEIKELISKYNNILIRDKKEYIEIENIKYQLIFHYLSKNSEITINSPYIWEHHHKNTKNNLINTTSLTKDRENNKIVIIYPSTRKIKRFINENEVEFVELKKTYNFYMVTKDNLEELLIKLNG